MKETIHLREDASAGQVAIDRRRLLQALGLSGAGAVLAGTMPRSVLAWAGGQARPSTVKAFPVTTVNHLSYAASDWVKTRDFYVDLLGMRVAWDDGKGCALEFGPMASPEGIYIRNVAAGAKPSINHFAFGIPNIMTHIAGMKTEMERWGLQNIRPDGEHGWIADDPAGYMLNTWVPEKDPAMFPGAARPCANASSAECKSAYEAGLKNLDKVPRPSGKGFTATSFSHIVLNVPEAKIPVEKEFYRDLMGMQVIYDQPANAAMKQRPQVFLRFGRNTLYLRPTPNATDKPYCNHFAFVIDNYDQKRVEAELQRRGLSPKPDSKMAWTIADPDGMRIEIAAWGLPEYIAKECKGSNTTCPGGPTG